MMPRGATFQMRVRRRQSDAKWRASVASCYETLKNIIPNRDKMPKRKISKALILQETENHIVNIENKFRDIMEQKAKGKGKSLIMQTDLGFVEAKLEDIRKEFSNKQQNLYMQNCSQRKKSNIPSDLELGLIDLRSSMCNLSVVPLDCLQEFLSSSNSNELCEMQHNESSGKDEMYLKQQILSLDSAKASTDNGRIRQETLNGQTSLIDTHEHETLPPRTPVKARRGRPSRRPNYQYRHDRIVSPEHSNISENYNSFTSENFYQSHRKTLEHASLNHSCERTPIQNRKRGRDSTSRSRTPARSTKQRLFETHSGFTPVKLPDVVPMTPGTPRSNSPQKSPFTALSSDNHQQDSPPRDEICMAPDLLLSPLDTAKLFCTESMDLMDLDDGHQVNENTPNQGKEKARKCGEDIQEKGTSKPRGQTHRSRSMHVKQPSEGEHRPARRCRRQLEKSFPTPEKKLATESPFITGVFESTDINCCQDFDGYFQFYQQMASEYPETPETASRVAQMWRNMSEAERETFVAMAALDTQSSTSAISDLSDDLLDLELEPIIDCFQPSVPECSSDSQLVPKYTGSLPEQDSIHSSPSVQMVPDTEEKSSSTTQDMASYLKMVTVSVPPCSDRQHTYQDMFDSSTFNTGAISQAAYMISANQFLDQGSCISQMAGQIGHTTLSTPIKSADHQDSQTVPDIDLVLNHLIQDKDFSIPTS